MTKPLLAVKGLTKNFSGIMALNGVQLTVGKGEVHALLGENGAGKSTLLKALSGAQPQTEGDIFFNDEQLNIHDTPFDRQLKGIVTIYQEFNLLPNMTVAENFFLGREPIKGIFVNEKAVNEEAQIVLDNLGLNISPETQVSRLSVAQQQMVEIARAMTLNAKLIIMDEPSAALSDKEVETLHHIVRDLKKRGISVIYVTHRLNEVFALCDRFTVFQDGKYSGEGNVKDTTIDDIIKMMVGRPVAFTRRPLAETHHTHRSIALSIKNLKREKPSLDPHGIALHNVSFNIHEGEILGIAGLVGAGRTEIARCLFGVESYTADEICLHGEKYHAISPLEALEKGVALVPEDRKKEGLVLGLSIRTNMTLPTLRQLLKLKWFVDDHKETRLIETYQQALHIKMASIELEARKLSGGNQQKVILARCMALNPKILIVDEPTRGIDVGAKSEVHQVLFDMAKKGVAVLVISSDLPEIMAISDRIVVLSEGRVTGELHGDEATEEKLMSMMAIGIQRDTVH